MIFLEKTNFEFNNPFLTQKQLNQKTNVFNKFFEEENKKDKFSEKKQSNLKKNFQEKLKFDIETLSKNIEKRIKTKSKNENESLNIYIKEIKTYLDIDLELMISLLYKQIPFKREEEVNYIKNNLNNLTEFLKENEKAKKKSDENRDKLEKSIKKIETNTSKFKIEFSNKEKEREIDKEKNIIEKKPEKMIQYEFKLKEKKDSKEMNNLINFNSYDKKQSVLSYEDNRSESSENDEISSVSRIRVHKMNKTPFNAKIFYRQSCLVSENIERQTKPIYHLKPTYKTLTHLYNLSLYIYTNMKNK